MKNNRIKFNIKHIIELLKISNLIYGYSTKLYQDAIKFASAKHAKKGQKVPATNLPYDVHISNVAMEILIAGSNTPDFDTAFAVQVALLHDTIEDTATDFEELKATFGIEVANAVSALSKNDTLPKDLQMQDSLNRIKALQPEVWSVKLADRITNLQPPPSHWDKAKRIKYYKEAQLIYDTLGAGNEYLALRLATKIKEYESYLNIEPSGSVSKKILYIDMDNVLVDFSSGIDKLDAKTKLEFKDNYDEVPGIFALMPPLKDAITSFNLLADNYDTYILTTAPWKNPSAWSDKLLWVQKYLGENAHKRLIISHHKNMNKGHYLVDDREKNGAGDFEGELIKFGSEHFRDWKSVVAYLL